MPRERLRLVLVAALAVYGGAVPYLARPLDLVVNVPAMVEVVDHVVPAILAAGAALWGVARERLGLPAAVVLFLSGLWMAGTHLPLLLQWPRGEIGPGPALFHSTPGIALLAAGALALLRWTVEEERALAATPPTP